MFSSKPSGYQYVSLWLCGILGTEITKNIVRKSTQNSVQGWALRLQQIQPPLDHYITGLPKAITLAWLKNCNNTALLKKSLNLRGNNLLINRMGGK